jgi:hypothetical protein
VAPGNKRSVPKLVKGRSEKAVRLDFRAHVFALALVAHSFWLISFIFGCAGSTLCLKIGSARHVSSPIHDALRSPSRESSLDDVT